MDTEQTIKQTISGMTDGQIIKCISEGPSTFQSGVFDLYLDEAKRRGLDIDSPPPHARIRVSDFPMHKLPRGIFNRDPSRSHERIVACWNSSLVPWKRGILFTEQSVVKWSRTRAESFDFLKISCTEISPLTATADGRIDFAGPAVMTFDYQGRPRPVVLKATFGFLHFLAKQIQRRLQDQYLAKCLQPNYHELPETRSWRDDPAFNGVLEPLNLGDNMAAAREAQALASRYPDFADLHRWWAKALLNMGSCPRARQVLHDALSRTNQKFPLLTMMAQVELEAGSLRDAVFWWVQALHCQESIEGFGGDVDAYLHLYYVADEAGLSQLASSLVERADLIQPSRQRLSSTAAASIKRLVSKSDAGLVRAVLEQVGNKYFTPAPQDSSASGQSGEPPDLDEVIHKLETLLRQYGVGGEEFLAPIKRLGEIGNKRALSILVLVRDQARVIDLREAAEEAIRKISSSS